MNLIKLANVPVGKSVDIFEKKFTILDHTDEGTLVLSDTIERDMPFREKRQACVALNDFRNSDICSYLNGKYFAELTNDGVYRTNAILDMSIDLKDVLCQREYGFFTTKVGLLTLEQYGKYFGIIPKISDRWWLATPYGTPLCSPCAYYTNSVCYVYTGGNYGSNDYSNCYGVRPTLLLDSSLLVSGTDISNDTSNETTPPLSSFSDEELLAEVKRRFNRKESE